MALVVMGCGLVSLDGFLVLLARQWYGNAVVGLVVKEKGNGKNVNAVWAVLCAH